MYTGHKLESTDEYLKALKIAASRLTQEILFRHGDDSPMGVRVHELNGAIQRVEWEIERERAHLKNTPKRGVFAAE